MNFIIICFFNVYVSTIYLKPKQYRFNSSPSLVWGYNIPWGFSWTTQLQPVDYSSGFVYFILNINNKAVFGILSYDNPISSSSLIYTSTEVWAWVSFIYSLSNNRFIIGFQDLTYSYIKIYNSGSSFSNYVLQTSIKIFGIAQSSLHSSM